MRKNLFLILVLLAVLISSCGQYKKYTYLQTDPLRKDTVYKQNFPFYKLQPADILYVQVKSLNKEVSELFNTSGTSSGGGAMQSGAGGGMYLYGQSVDINGNIQLPVLGNVKVSGLTVDQARDTIQRRALVFISDAIIEAKLVSFKVSLLGEVKGGQVTVMNDRANILEVLAMSGGVPYTGNHKNILILRSKNGFTQTIKVDLSKRELLSSPDYYLQPNDVVYVEPRKSAAFRLWMADYTTYLTAFTSLTTIYLLILQLKK
jgi:polysaccharide export outer membrane protein